MKILVISDLHICRKDSAGTFGWEDDELVYSLEIIREYYSIDQIVLNGDIYELYKYKLNDIQKARPGLSNYLKSDFFIMLKGNHDMLLPNGSDYLVITNSDGKKIHIEHGHNADYLNGTSIGRLVSRVMFKIIMFLTAIDVLNRLYLKIVEFNDGYRVPRKYNSYKYLKYALRLLRRNDVVILGHTHKQEYHKTYHMNSKKKYFNTGSCSFGRFQGIVLDTETLKYDMLHMEKDEILKLLEPSRGRLALAK